MRREPIQRWARGFTLVELLFVVGVIILLLAILSPMVSKVRQASYAASTQQQIASLVGAIERYQQAFGAYPGVFGNNQIGSSPLRLTNIDGSNVDLTAASVTPAPANLTMSENLVLSLLGGLQVTFNPASDAVTSYAYSATALGQGAVSLSPASSQRYPNFFDGSAASLSSGASGLAGATDSNVPEFVDRFPIPTPIIYLRARAGAPGISDPSGSPNTTQYNPAHLTAYTGTGIFAAGKNFATADAYFQNPSMAGQPRQKDSYLLISAGKDRTYGTKDDICNFGTPGD